MNGITLYTLQLSSYNIFNALKIKSKLARAIATRTTFLKISCGILFTIRLPI